jgi:hypothetical protein
MIKKIAAIFFLLVSSITNAQEAQVEMADGFRADGKIYVVTSVMAIIFLSVIFYLIVIDRKVKKIEDDLNNKNL